MSTTAEKNLVRWLAGWKRKPELAWVAKLSRQLPDARIYLVGGMVRDLALGRPSQDFDFVVAGVPQQKLEQVLRTIGAVDFVGKKFGVYKLRPKGQPLTEPIDVALPRTENAGGSGAYRDVTVQSDHRLPIASDLSRRDFTVNALALPLSTQDTVNSKQIVDPYGGLTDIVQRRIRAVGEPKERFAEDYSRMLRAVRFACQLDFEIEPTTWQAIQAGVGNLNQLAGGKRVVPLEVIAKELVKAMRHHPVSALQLLDTSGLLEVTMPELHRMKGCPQPKQYHDEGDVWQHTILALIKLESKEFRKEFDPMYKKSSSQQFKISDEVIWALLFHDLGKPYTMTVTDRIRFNGHDVKSAQLFREAAHRLRLSSAGLDTAKVEQIIAKHMLLAQGTVTNMKATTLEKYFFSETFPGNELRQVFFADISATIPISGKPDFSTYRELLARLKQLQRGRRGKTALPDPLLDGHEIMALLKIKPGKPVQEVKDWLREAQLRGKVKTKAQAKTAVQKQFHGR